MILILTQCFPSRLGGIESLVSNLALGLSATENIIVFADQNNITLDFIYDKKNQDKIIVTRFGGIRFLRRRKKVIQVKKLIESKKIKLVLCESWKSIELVADHIRKNSIPIICLAHGNEILSNNLNKKKRIINTLNKVNSVIANSVYTQSLVKKLVNANIPVNVIYPGATDLRNIKPKIVPNINGSPVILTLARLEKRKGHFYIIESIKKLLSDFPNIKYIIAGEGPEEKSLKKLVVDNSLQNNIIFTGSVNEAEKKYLFEVTDLMVMPTLDETQNLSIEGFGITYLEASFFGIPSIASNVGGTPEAVINDLTGIIIDSNDQLFDAIKLLLKDEKKRKRLGISAQKRSINNFDWNNVTKKYISAFTKIY